MLSSIISDQFLQLLIQECSGEVSIIVPAPLSAALLGKLRKYIASGDGALRVEDIIIMRNSMVNTR